MIVCLTCLHTITYAAAIDGELGGVDFQPMGCELSDRNSLVIVGFIMGCVVAYTFAALIFAHAIEETEADYRTKMIEHGVAHWEVEADGSTTFVEHELPTNNEGK